MKLTVPGRRFLVVGAVALASTAASMAVPSPAAGTGQVSAGSAKPVPGNPPDVLDNYGELSPLLEAEPDRWAGVFVDGDVLVVKYVNQSRTAAEERLKDLGIVRGVELREGLVTKSSLDQASKSVAGLSGTERDLSGWGPDYASDDIVFETASPNEALTAVVKATVTPFGVSASMVEAPGVPRAESRYYDRAPITAETLSIEQWK